MKYLSKLNNDFTHFTKYKKIVLLKLEKTGLFQVLLND